MLISSLVLISAAFVLDTVGRELAADAAQAIRGSGRTQDWFARTIGTSPAKLSTQLNGQAAFTLLCRFGCKEIRESTMFWPVFLDLQHRRVNHGVSVAQARMEQLIVTCEALTGAVSDVLSGRRAVPCLDMSNQRRSA